jgi:hypothetical protein
MDRLPIPRNFQKKNNAVIKENSWTLDFCKNTPKLFWNYVLVPENLHLGPYSIFYLQLGPFLNYFGLFYFLFNLLS